jgi:hypothetical protein
MTADQLRSARSLLRCSTYQLAAWSGVDQQVIAHFERTGRMMRPISALADRDRLGAIRTALEAAGVEFTGGEAPGVRLRPVRTEV